MVYFNNNSDIIDTAGINNHDLCHQRYLEQYY